MKSARPSIEPLEARISPATLDVVGGAVTYTAGALVGNTLVVSINGSDRYVFSDAENITLTAGAMAAGFTGGGTNSVSGPNGSVLSILVMLGDQLDVFTLSGLDDPLAVVDGGGTDTITVSAGATSNAQGNVLLQAETITVNSLAGVNVLTLSADNLAVAGAVGVTGNVVIQPLSAGRAINLGTDSGTSLNVTDTELDRFSAPAKIVVGSTNAGSLTVSAPITVTNTNVLSLKTGGSVSTSGAGAIAVPSLAVSVNASISLDGSNDVDVFAGQSLNADNGLTMEDADGFEIGIVDGVTGIFMPSGGITTLNAGLVTQAVGATLRSPRLSLLGAGPFVLSEAGNDVATLGASIGSSLFYTDATGIDVGTAGTTSGITSGGVTLTALGGDIHVLNGNGAAAADISTGSGQVRIEAGSAGSDFAIILDANAGITTTSQTRLTADRMVLGASIDTGMNVCLINTIETTTAIDLGGADVAGTLGLTDVELDRITAGAIVIGDVLNPLTVSAAISPANTGILALSAAGVSGAGGITIDTLEIAVRNTVVLNGANDVNFLRLLAASLVLPSTVSFSDADGFALGRASNVQTTLPDFSLVTLTAGGVGVSVDPGSDLLLGLSGVTPGVGHDQIVVNGALTLTGATLIIEDGSNVPFGTEFVLLSNDGNEPVVGTFAGLPEGAVVPNFSPPARITYTGGDGNDVAVVTFPALAVQLSNGNKTATFRDVDGDAVTVTTNKGAFDGSEFAGIETGANGAGQLQRLTLDGDFTGANITITAKPSTDGGNGFVNVGFLNATGVDLGKVKIAGDLGRLAAGTPAGDPAVPGLRSLSAESIGLLGDSTQGGGGITGVVITGALPKFAVSGDVRASLQIVGADTGKLGSAFIGGSFVQPGFGGAAAVEISAEAGIGSLKIGGDIRVGAGVIALIESGTTIGSIIVGGSLVGVSQAASVSIQAFGRGDAPASGVDLAIKSVKIGGSVEGASIVVGSSFSQGNADASIGRITVGGDWIGSHVRAGTDAGPDNKFGTADDAKFSFAGTRDNPDISSSIGLFTVNGQALGTAQSTTDMFGVVAERIGKAKVGGRTFAFTKGATPEAFFAAPTFDGEGAENPAFDFTIREIGSATPTPTFGGSQLDISSDGKTATFIDVDGDRVTVKRSAGEFVAGNFLITDNAVGGGQLNTLLITPGPDDARVNLRITAQPGPDGGNGCVNVGVVAGFGVAFGNVSIAGDVGNFTGGLAVAGQFGTLAFTAHSLRALGSTTGAGTSDSLFTGGVEKVTVEADVRGAGIFAPGAGGRIGTATVGGALLSITTPARIVAAEAIGTVKIGGSVSNAQIGVEDGALGTVTIGGDLLGGGTAPTIFGFGQFTEPTSGPDVAIKKVIVKGSVERATIEAGTGGDATNADASIGKIVVGRAWLASSVLAGADDGADNRIGTADDTKDIGTVSTRDRAGVFSTIASVVIKGQALGTAATTDTFGIVAEQINKAQIGKKKFAFDPGERDAADAFALAPTGPGSTGLLSDFFLREIVV